MKISHSEAYKIQTREDDGKTSSSTVIGSIIGPFGVADDPVHSDAYDDFGFYRVTHLHSGLKVRELCSKDRSRSIAACIELAEKLPFWASHKSSRIALENGLELEGLRAAVLEVSRKHGCDGETIPKGLSPNRG